MSRKSTAALSVVPLGRAPRLQPPAGLTEAQAAIWREVVESLPAEHFHVADTPLLRSYVEVSARIGEAERHLRRGAVRAGRLSPWFGILERGVRLQMALGRSLRLTVSSRLDRTTAGTHARGDSRVQPWAGERTDRSE